MSTLATFKNYFKDIKGLKTQLESGLKSIAYDTGQIKQKIAGLEANILREIGKLEVLKFDFTVNADRLLFYLKLEYFLENSYRIFIEQNKAVRKLLIQLRSKGHEATTMKKGLDEKIYDLHKHDAMDDEDLKLFAFIREVTDETERFNWYAKHLLMNNPEFIDQLPKLRDLLIHYSTWQAKYQLYKGDPNMAVVYVGPDQKAGFPDGMDSDIDLMISQLKRETKMTD